MGWYALKFRGIARIPHDRKAFILDCHWKHWKQCFWFLRSFSKRPVKICIIFVFYSGNEHGLVSLGLELLGTHNRYAVSSAVFLTVCTDQVEGEDSNHSEKR